MRILRPGLVLVALSLCLGLAGCDRSTTASIREIGGALLGDLLQDLATPESMAQLLVLDSKEKQMDFVLDKARSRLDSLAALCRDALATGDKAALEEWIHDAMPMLETVYTRYGDKAPKVLSRALKGFDPRLEYTLRAGITRALVYLADRPVDEAEGLYPINGPTLADLVTAFQASLDEDGKLTMTKPLKITKPEVAIFGDILQEEWDRYGKEHSIITSGD